MRTQEVSKDDLQKAVIGLAKSSKITTLQAFAAMQKAALQMKRQDIVEKLHQLKMEFIYS